MLLFDTRMGHVLEDLDAMAGSIAYHHVFEKGVLLRRKDDGDLVFYLRVFAFYT